MEISLKVISVKQPNTKHFMALVSLRIHFLSNKNAISTEGQKFIYYQAPKNFNIQV